MLYVDIRKPVTPHVQSMAIPLTYLKWQRGLRENFKFEKPNYSNCLDKLSETFDCQSKWKFKRNSHDMSQ